MDADQFCCGFVSWIQAISQLIAGEIVALDGKTLCGSHDGTLDNADIHVVSAWASVNRLVLGQLKVDDKSNEITAIPALNMLRQDKSAKCGIKARRLKAGWSDKYLLKLLLANKSLS